MVTGVQNIDQSSSCFKSNLYSYKISRRKKFSKTEENWYGPKSFLNDLKLSICSYLNFEHWKPHKKELPPINLCKLKLHTATKIKKYTKTSMIEHVIKNCGDPRSICS